MNGLWIMDYEWIMEMTMDYWSPLFGHHSLKYLLVIRRRNKVIQVWKDMRVYKG